jgi:hypothetical protein
MDRQTAEASGQLSMIEDTASIACRLASGVSGDLGTGIDASVQNEKNRFVSFVVGHHAGCNNCRGREAAF